VAEPDDLRRFEALVLPHLDAAHNLARWLTRDPEHARDAVQEATLRAFRFFASYKGGDARPWFLTIVRNAVASWRERERRADVIPFSALEQEEDGEPFIEAIASPADDPEALLQRLEQGAVIDRLLRRLPPEFREALVLREMEGLSYKEIAAVTHVPIGTVMSRLARGRQLLLAWGRELTQEGCDHGL
jgi:RNA polymerase sigma factor (sigma-70 family)